MQTRKLIQLTVKKLQAINLKK